MGDDADLKIAGFRMWVYGQQFPHAEEEWDANWLSVKCECEASGARVCAVGSFVSLMEIDLFAKEMEALSTGASRISKIDFMEPELKIAFEVGSRGTVEFAVELSPDPLRQQHRFVFEIDLSYFAAAVAQCNSILSKHPFRGLG